MTKQKIGLALMAGLLASGFALANHHEEGGSMHGEGMRDGPMPTMFNQFDKNKDGQVSREEAREGMDSLFTEIDSNKDGLISKDEMQAHHKEMHEKMGSIMREKWKAADKDGDGALSRAEVDAGNLPRLARDFDKLDTNKDGKLSADEIRVGMPRHSRSNR